MKTKDKADQLDTEDYDLIENQGNLDLSMDFSVSSFSRADCYQEYHTKSAAASSLPSSSCLSESAVSPTPCFLDPESFIQSLKRNFDLYSCPDQVGETSVEREFPFDEFEYPAPPYLDRISSLDDIPFTNSIFDSSADFELRTGYHFCNTLSSPTKEDDDSIFFNM